MTSALSAARIVTAWEAGARRSPLDKAIAVLWAAGEGAEAADLPLAERDRRLLAVRRATFGATLSALANCAGCSARVEVALDTTVLAGALVMPEAQEVVDAAGQTLRLRPVTSRDLAAAADVAAERMPSLLRNRVTGTNTFSPAVAIELDALIEEREAAAELSVRMSCVECGADWTETLDVPVHVWAEVEAAALRIMREVAEIAAAFGWSEAQILAMSDARRTAYLHIARGGGE